MANLITRAGANRVLTMDLHAAQIQGFFDLPVDHLYAAPVLNDYFLNTDISLEDAVIVSPDEGSIKRALGHAKRLGGSVAIIDKRRTSALSTEQANLIGGPIEGKVAIMFDDMISTAGSIRGAAQLMHKTGCPRDLCGDYPSGFCGNALQNLLDAKLASVICTDTNPISSEYEKNLPKLTVLTVAPLLGEAIKRIHRNESVSRLFR